MSTTTVAPTRTAPSAGARVRPTTRSTGHEGYFAAGLVCDNCDHTITWHGLIAPMLGRAHADGWALTDAGNDLCPRCNGANA